MRHRTAQTAAIVMMLGLTVVASLVATGPGRAANKSFDLYGSFANGWGLTSSTESFPGPQLTVQQGDVVTITVHATDGLDHQFFIDLNHNDVPDSGEPTSASFNTTATVTFTASTVGTFDYYCYFHEGSMKGDFVVQSSGTGPTSPAGTDSTLLYLGIGSVVVVAAVGAAVAMMMRKKK